MNMLSRDTLHRGGFAGIKETRLVQDARIGGKLDTWDGLGNFVYLADARYLPYGKSGSAAGYKIYNTGDGKLHRIYGGDKEQTKSFDSHTVIDTGLVYGHFSTLKNSSNIYRSVNLP